jgi:hypothetical protein
MLGRVSVHSILPELLTRAASAVFDAAGIRHIAHGTANAVEAASVAAADPHALALVGPYRSAHVAEAVEVTAPAGLPLLAPVATWAGVTRDDEPGCDDPARHLGTVLRLVARDTEVATRIAGDVVAAGRQALVVAGEHDYGRQLDDQLRLASLPRAERVEDADLVIVAGLAGEAEIERAAASAPLPLVAFDGAQGAGLGEREVRIALPYAPVDGVPTDELLAGAECAHRAADLVVRAVAEGARDRPEMLTALRRLGGFDAHGDPTEPRVWLWRADDAWNLRPDRPL